MKETTSEKILRVLGLPGILILGFVAISIVEWRESKKRKRK